MGTVSLAYWARTAMSQSHSVVDDATHVGMPKCVTGASAELPAYEAARKVG